MITTFIEKGTHQIFKQSLKVNNRDLKQVN